jgi:hypothetical protein
MVMSYRLMVDVGVPDGMGLDGFVPAFQRLFNSEGGMEGQWTVADMAPGSVVVRLDRDVDEDRVYAERRSPDLATGLLEQVKAEFKAANKDTGGVFRYFTVVAGPLFDGD